MAGAMWAHADGESDFVSILSASANQIEARWADEELNPPPDPDASRPIINATYATSTPGISSKRLTENSPKRAPRERRTFRRTTFWKTSGGAAQQGPLLPDKWLWCSSCNENIKANGQDVLWNYSFRRVANGYSRPGPASNGDPTVCTKNSNNMRTKMNTSFAFQAQRVFEAAGRVNLVFDAL
ncbi:hypothetical protein C8J57DRAFT_1224547 [Mycena rebaudengoi]|nr:hypothetical protein C8J57DRAFT_1224547 [Mycena rebaudengoi]